LHYHSEILSYFHDLDNEMNKTVCPLILGDQHIL
jgi:hypothetical protein